MKTAQNKYRFQYGIMVTVLAFLLISLETSAQVVVIRPQRPHRHHVRYAPPPLVYYVPPPVYYAPPPVYYPPQVIVVKPKRHHRRRW